MSTNDFVCCCFGIDGKVIDDLCDEFDVDLIDDDIFEAFREFDPNNSWGVARCLLSTVLDRIIEDYPELDSEKFDYDFSSPSYPFMYYNEVEFHTKAELDEIAERLDKAA